MESLLGKRRESKSSGFGSSVLSPPLFPQEPEESKGQMPWDSGPRSVWVLLLPVLQQASSIWKPALIQFLQKHRHTVMHYSLRAGVVGRQASLLLVCVPT